MQAEWAFCSAEVLAGLFGQSVGVTERFAQFRGASVRIQTWGKTNFPGVLRCVLVQIFRWVLRGIHIFGVRSAQKFVVYVFV